MPQDTEAWAVAGVYLGVAVAGRRTLPLPVLCALCVLYPFVYLRGLASEFHLIPIMVLGYAAAQRGHRLALVVASCALAVLLLFSPLVHTASLDPSDLWSAIYHARAEWADEGTVGFRGPWRADWSGLVVAQVATLGVVLLGAMLAAKRAAATELERRNRELERLRVVDADRAVAQERIRISRELHDVVAHHLTAIVMRAQGAHHVAAAQPREAVDAVGWIAEVGREALVATRDAVGSLRDPTTGAATAADGDMPLVGHLEQIVNRMADVGIVDSGTRFVAAVAGGGTGLLGLRERVASCGGGLTYGPAPEGGWRVEAWVPLRLGAPA